MTNVSKNMHPHGILRNRAQTILFFCFVYFTLCNICPYNAILYVADVLCILQGPSKTEYLIFNLLKAIYRWLDLCLILYNCNKQLKNSQHPFDISWFNDYLFINIFLETQVPIALVCLSIYMF